MNKYHARITYRDNIRFHSAREAARYQELLLLLRAGEISDLRLQVRYPLAVNGQRICVYVADFVYTENGQQIVEDCKGVRTRLYMLKKKLMKALHGITIEES